MTRSRFPLSRRAGRTGPAVSSWSGISTRSSGPHERIRPSLAVLTFVPASGRLWRVVRRLRPFVDRTVRVHRARRRGTEEPHSAFPVKTATRHAGELPGRCLVWRPCGTRPTRVLADTKAEIAAE